MAGMLDLSEFEKIMITMLRALMEKIDNRQKNRTCKQGDGNSKNQKEMLKIKKMLLIGSLEDWTQLRK